MTENRFIENFTIGEIKNEKMAAIYQYWLNIKGDKLMPARRDINPSDIPRLLPHITLVRLEDDRYKLTLVGSENIKAYGAEVTGKYLDEIPSLYKDAKERYDWLVENKRPYIYEGQLNWSKKNYLDYSIIGFPLSANGIDVNALMFAGFYYFPKDRRTSDPLLDQ